MSRVGNIYNIPHFIKARGAEALRVLMLQNNASRGAEFQYFDISFSEGYWYAWYYDQAKEYLAVLKKVK